MQRSSGSARSGKITLFDSSDYKISDGHKKHFFYIMKSTYQSVFILFFSIISISLFAQEPDQDKKKDGSGFAGPDQVERQLKDDYEAKESFLKLRFLQPYFDFKNKLKENSGFSFGLDYTGAYFAANKSLGLNDAGSGMIRLYGSWELTGRGGKNTGALVSKIEHRHKYGAIPVVALGSELGYIGAIEPTFNDEGFRMTNFYWRQRVWQGRIVFIAGLLDPADYLDVYMLASPWQHFTNLTFSTGSSAMYIPNDASLGVAVAGYITNHIYALVSLDDNNSNPTEPFKSFETFFSKHQYYKSAEIGWVSSKERQFFDNIHITYWHSDGSEETSSPSGWGLNFSATWYVQDKFMPFLRGGYAEDANTMLQKSVSAGCAYQAVPGGHLLGAAINWGEINESTYGQDLDNQITMEVFYRMQVTTEFAITPDVQYLINPALNTDVTSIFLWGLRGRIVL